jgi:hypothetical protein
LSFIPFYRFHKQTEADFFKPFGEHVDGESEFFTSDYDLSAFTSHKYGLGVRYSPVYGISRLKLPWLKSKLLMLKGIDLRYALYNRSDGLDASIISFDLNFVIK